jgi:hypothetical protein
LSNVAIDVEQNLRNLCGAETLARVEVKNLDAWVHGFMRAQKLDYRIVYDRKQEATRQAWQAATAVRDTTLDLPDDFYEQELEHVILAQGITTLDAYRVVRRTGRSGMLSRAKRDAVWPVFEEYRGQLASRRLKEVDDTYREVVDLLAGGQTGESPYCAIIVDETQDLGPQALRLLRSMVAAGSNDLFLVGDGHQRIYTRHRAAMSKCGIDIRGRARKLYLNYRTTDEIRRPAVALLEGCEVDDLDNGHDETRRYKSLSHGPVPTEVTAEGLEAATGYALGFINQLKAIPLGTYSPSVCVIAPGERNRDALAAQLVSHGIRCVTIRPRATTQMNAMPFIWPPYTAPRVSSLTR